MGTCKITIILLIMAHALWAEDDVKSSSESPQGSRTYTDVSLVKSIKKNMFAKDETRDERLVQGGLGGEGDSSPSSEVSALEDGETSPAVNLPKAEALQGGPQSRHTITGLQGGPQGVPKALHGLHLGKIPPSCSLCSRERNLCRIISGIFTRSPLPYGYSLVTPVPAGVCNLTITEIKPSKNFFALRRPDSTYVLNGNWDIQAAGQYLAGGTTFTYTPSDHSHGERLSAPGPLTEPIELMLISQSPNPGIKYEYRLPLPEYLGGSGLSSGLGTQPSGSILPNIGGTRGSPRIPSIGLRTPNSGVPSSNANPGRVPYGPSNPNIVNGNFGALNPSRVPSSGVGPNSGQGSFNAGSVPIPGVNSQGVIGSKPVGSGNQPRIPGIPGLPPLGSNSQASGNIPLIWKPAQDGSRGTGLGTPFQPSPTFPRISGGGTVPGSLPSPVGFPGQRPPGQSSLEGSGTIPGGSGFPPEFPQNSVPLRPVPISGGRRPGARQPSAQAGQGDRLATTAAPDTHRTRHHHGAKGVQGRRKPSAKLPGSAQNTPFGPGVQLTQPNVDSTSSSTTTVRNVTEQLRTPRKRGKGSRRRHQQREGEEDETAQGTNRRKDRTGRHRRRKRSRFQWAEKGFTPCSKPCGGGNQTTLLSCEHRRKKTVVPDRHCAHISQPETHTIMCNLKPCPAAWVPGDWGTCSVSCGMGVQTRPLLCKQQVSPTFTMMVPEGACLSPPAVPSSQVCEMGPCPSSSPQWQTGTWGNCSSQCGLGSRGRQVTCVVAGVPVRGDRCNSRTKPASEESCDMGSCATNTWFFSSWSDQCSESCGTGVQTRKVHCLTNADDPIGECPTEGRPDSSRPCRGESGCGGQWFVGPWGSCSAACGVGRQTRPVVCSMFSNGQWRVGSDAQCTVEARPPDSRECNVQSCMPEWYTSDWSQCSASCEGGIMRREVTCLNANQRPSADCDNTTKPSTRQPCHLHSCSTLDKTSVTTSPQTISVNSTSTNIGTNSIEEGGDGEGSHSSSSVTVAGTDDRRSDSEDDSDRGRERTNDSVEDSFAVEERERENDEDEDDGIVYDEDDEEGNELVVLKETGSAINAIPDKDAQGDESVSGDDDQGDEREREEEQEEEKKKKKKKRKDRRKNREESKGEPEPTEPSLKEEPTTESPVCIDRIKNCHLVFRARLCRLKYYNKLCCRTCSHG